MLFFSFMLFQAEIASLRQRDEAMTKQVNEIQAENRSLLQPWKEAEEAVSFLTKKLSSFDKDASMLESTKERVGRAKRRIVPLREQLQILSGKFEDSEKQRDGLYSRMASTVAMVRQRTEEKNSLLEERISSFQNALDEKVCFHSSSLIISLLGNCHCRDNPNCRP